MKTFTAHLNESLNSSYLLDLPHNEGNRTRYSFTDGKHNYEISFFEYVNTAEVMFNSDGNLAVMNHGANALKVYATIGTAIKHYLKVQPSTRYLEFSAADQRTEKVYQLLAKRLIKERIGSSVFHDPISLSWRIYVK